MDSTNARSASDAIFTGKIYTRVVSHSALPMAFLEIFFHDVLFVVIKGWVPVVSRCQLPRAQYSQKAHCTHTRRCSYAMRVDECLLWRCHPSVELGIPSSTSRVERVGASVCEYKPRNPCIYSGRKRADCTSKHEYMLTSTL